MIAQDYSRNKRIALIACYALFVAIAAVLRSWQISDSLWVDELHTSWTVANDWSNIAPRAAQGNQPPLYFYLVKISTELFGKTEIGLRMPSLIAGVAAVALLGGFVWRFSHSAVATLLTMFVAAVDHEMLFYAGEARSYALIQLFAVVHWWALYEICRCQRPLNLRLAWIAWIGSGAIMVSLHLIAGYIAAVDGVILAGVVIWRLTSQRSKESQQRDISYLYWVAAGWVAILLAMAPNLGLYSEVAARRSQWSQFIPNDPSLSFFFAYIWPVPAIIAAPLLGVAISFIVSRWRSPQHASENCEAKPPSLWLTASCLGVAIIPVFAAWVITISGVAPIFHARYFAPSLPAFLCLPAILMLNTRGRLLRIATATVIAIAAVWFSGLDAAYVAEGRFVIDRNEDWRSAAHALNHDPRFAEDDSHVLVYSGLMEADALSGDDAEQWRDYSSLPLRGIYQLTNERPIIALETSAVHLSETDIAHIRDEKSFVLIVRGASHFGDELAADYADWLPGEFQITASEQFGGIMLYRFARER
ncbi:MAG: glycosyltransferase family 39 protein [bacterium]|nr:glycosyltransferase family 39 protein [bacterium]